MDGKQRTAAAVTDDDDAAVQCNTNHTSGAGAGADPDSQPQLPPQPQPGLQLASSWNAALSPTAVPCTVHAAVVRKWLDAAAAEHASVASFARHSLQLMSVGAPAWLVQGAHAAAADEIKHAQLCYGLASKYSNKTVSPGPLDVGGTILGRVSGASGNGAGLRAGGGMLSPAAAAAVEVIESVVAEGCIGETMAAARAAITAHAAVDAVVAKVLTIIAADEMRHAGP